MELVRELKPYDAYYNTHWRKTGLRMKVPGHHYAIDGIREACEIGLQTGVKTQLSHLSSGYSIAPMPDPELDAAAARATLRVFDAYREQGAQLAFDVIPNTSGGFQCIPYLVMYFVPWVRMSGGVEHFIENLQSFDYREEFHEYIMSGKQTKVSGRSNSHDCTAKAADAERLAEGWRGDCSGISVMAGTGSKARVRSDAYASGAALKCCCARRAAPIKPALLPWRAGSNGA